MKKKFAEIYIKTLEKDLNIHKKGYNIITIWENDWDKFVKENKIK